VRVIGGAGLIVPISVNFALHIKKLRYYGSAEPKSLLIFDERTKILSQFQIVNLIGKHLCISL
jgi:hypothetical protein